MGCNEQLLCVCMYVCIFYFYCDKKNFCRRSITLANSVVKERIPFVMHTLGNQQRVNMIYKTGVIPSNVSDEDIRVKALCLESRANTLN